MQTCSRMIKSFPKSFPMKQITSFLHTKTRFLGSGTPGSCWLCGAGRTTEANRSALPGWRAIPSDETSWLVRKNLKTETHWTHGMFSILWRCYQMDPNGGMLLLRIEGSIASLSFTSAQSADSSQVLGVGVLTVPSGNRETCRPWSASVGADVEIGVGVKGVDLLGQKP